jgi:hypothetical protein
MGVNEYSVRSELGYIGTTMTVATQSHGVVGHGPSEDFIKRTGLGDTEDQTLTTVPVEGVVAGGDNCRRELRTVRECWTQRPSGLT